MHQREFDADGEKEQDDPDLRQHLDRADVRDEVQSVGADECAGNQEPRDRGKPELVEYEDDGDRHREDHEQICKHAVVSHDRNRSGVRSEGVRRGKCFERSTPHVSWVQAENTPATGREQGKAACSTEAVCYDGFTRRTSQADYDS